MQRPRVVAFCAALVLALASQADAGHILTLTAGSGESVTIDDGDIADLWGSGGAEDGVVVWAGAVGSWIINVTVGVSGSLSGSSELDLASINVSGGSGGNLTITHTDTGFAQYGSGQLLIGGNTSGQVTYAAYWGSDTSLYDHQIGSTLLFTGGTYDGTQIAAGPTAGTYPSGTYSMTQVVTIAHSGYGVTGFDANLAVVSVPEQASIALVGLAFMVLGGLRFRWKDQRMAGAADRA